MNPSEFVRNEASIVPRHVCIEGHCPYCDDEPFVDSHHTPHPVQKSSKEEEFEE